MDSKLGNQSSNAREVRELRAAELKLHAYRVGGGGNIEFTLPCGEKRLMTRTEAQLLVARIQIACEWLVGTVDRKEF